MFLTQYNNDTILKHILLDLSMLEDIGIFLPGQMYDTIYSNNTEHLSIILLASIINTETYDLICNPVDNATIYVYFDKFNTALFENLSRFPYLKILVKEDQELPKNKYNKKQIIKVPYLYSEILLNQILMDPYNYDNIHISCNISEINKIPEDLSNILYPNEPLINIKLFGNDSSSMNIPNNVGMVTDHSMINIIKSSSLYIDINKIFLAYSLIMDIPTLSLVANNRIPKTKLDRSSLEYVKRPSDIIDLADIHRQSYKYFFKEKVL